MNVGAIIKMAIPMAIRKVVGEMEFITALKHNQMEILMEILNGNDCFAILPTGYGKSLPYQMFLPVKRALNPENHDTVLVCCPLISLMEDQVRRVQQFGVTAALRGTDQDANEAIDDGTISVIFASPEALAEEWVRQIKDVSLIVVDECHTISMGGLDVDEEKAFRKYFRYIGTLRSIFPDATVLALSATCTLKMKTQIMSNLNLSGKARVIETSPNRANIKYVVKRTPIAIEETFFWLIDKLCELKKDFPRILIYCNSIKDVCQLFNYVVTETNLMDQNVVEMYHSETPQEKKEHIVQNLGLDSQMKVVIATTALGLGVDVKNCHGVILFGPPKDVVDLLQESGRCGRNDEPSVCVIFCNRYQLNHISKEVKEVIGSVECRRRCLLKNFTSEEVVSDPAHMCCDLCVSHCNCGSCTPHPIEVLVGTFSAKAEDALVSSDSDTISYEYESDVSFDGGFE
ncbi:RQL3-like protein [Mya arenaria]|uniref:DNA 3'-5' helicase n=1 Tax=Mya arenaria TaxID=6604 RepID=A0ABY7F6N3_MYAAR|nr:RQL3-like protein [Mya arenaria]WAR27497.1 RQL3-like protein [Mya arenaria]